MLSDLTFSCSSKGKASVSNDNQILGKMKNLCYSVLYKLSSEI